MSSRREARTAAEHFAGEMSEAQLQRSILDAAAFSKWRAYHTLNSKGSNPGFPDLVLVKGSRLIFAELKTERGRLSSDQREWIGALEAVADLTRMVEEPRPGGGRHNVVPLKYAVASHELPASVEVYVWRPRDWFSGAISEVLNPRATRVPKGSLVATSDQPADDEAREEEVSNGRR